MSYLSTCHREDYNECPFWDPDFECIYGGGCYMEILEELEESKGESNNGK